MTTQDSGLQDAAIPLLTEVLEETAPPLVLTAPASTAPASTTPVTRPAAPVRSEPAPAISAAPAPYPPAAAPATSIQPAPAARPAVQVAPNERGIIGDEVGIPVLTVPLQTNTVAPPLRPRPANPVPVSANTPPAVAPVAAQPGLQRAATDGSEGGVDAMLARLSPDEMEQLQHKLSERILRQLQGRIDFVLEQRVRDSLADVLQLAMGGLTNDIKRGLQQTLEEVVGRAVTQEIARLQSGKK